MIVLVRAFILSLSILLILLTSPASAQQPSVTSKQAADAKLSGIDVVLEQIPSGKRLTTRTDDGGRFSFRDVDSGKYRLRIGYDTPRN
jgi:Carboxypeptidase regulatory-like domain